jgi:hypothetical protein
VQEIKSWLWETELRDRKVLKHLLKKNIYFKVKLIYSNGRFWVFRTVSWGIVEIFLKSCPLKVKPNLTIESFVFWTELIRPNQSNYHYAFNITRVVAERLLLVLFIVNKLRLISYQVLSTWRSIRKQVSWRRDVPQIARDWFGTNGSARDPPENIRKSSRFYLLRKRWQLTA